MSGAEAMDGLHKPEPTCYVPTEADKTKLAERFDAVHRAEVGRRWFWWVSSLGGWGAFGAMSAITFMALLTVHDRPVPRDRFALGFIRADGSYDAPVPKEDWTPSQREIALTNSIIRYVTARESYTWETSNANYHIVSPMSQAGPNSEQQRYQDFILGKSPDRPEARLGQAGSDWIDGIRVFDRGDNAREVHFLRHTRLPSGAVLDENRMALVTFDDNANIPMNIRQQFDPGGIVITKYETGPAPGATR